MSTKPTTPPAVDLAALLANGERATPSDTPITDAAEALSNPLTCPFLARAMERELRSLRAKLADAETALAASRAFTADYYARAEAAEAALAAFKETTQAEMMDCTRRICGMTEELAERDADSRRLDWLEEQQALCEADDGSGQWQEWRVEAPANFRGDVRAAINAAREAQKAT